MPKSTEAHTIEEHFAGRDPAVKAIYAKLVAASRKLGPVNEEPKKTSIHLAAGTAFAGVATRKTALILTLKSTADVKSPRIIRHERASTNRWHLEVRLEHPDELDLEVLAWLKASYAMSRQS